MGWSAWYLDGILIPLGLLINFAYHVCLWHKVQTQPSITILGIDSDGRCLWVAAMIKDIDKKNIVAVQSIRNMITGSVFMASTSILLCCGLGAVISSTYSVKKPLNESIYGAQGEFAVSLPNLHTTRCVMTLVTTEYLSELLRKATVLSIVGNRLLHTGLPLLLWIFGPMMAFSCSVAMLLVLHKVDFVATKEKFNIGGINC
ncbi:hypothetical protein RJT34_26144 [Clitoria ternatea]|uniref:Uncharacterized protein n=1 Tax=Clitoria ternatea TaxID=43366 RepID=A0AAN9FBI0_CLITE